MSPTAVGSSGARGGDGARRLGYSGDEKKSAKWLSKVGALLTFFFFVREGCFAYGSRVHDKYGYGLPAAVGMQVDGPLKFFTAHTSIIGLHLFMGL